MKFRLALFWDTNPKKIDIKKTSNILLSGLPILVMIKRRAGFLIFIIKN